MRAPEPTPRASGVAPPTFRLPDATRIGGVHVLVSDLQRSVAYYEQILGLRVRESMADTVAFASQTDDQFLVTLHTAPDVRPARRGAFGLYHFAVLLPDRAALGRFTAHLGRMNVRVGMADHLVSEALYLWDPDGLGIEVYADRPRSTWRVNGRELAMATDPLDVPDLVAAAGGQAWTGMPAGTTIGHVHLHVGGLAEAEAFYHRALGFDKIVWSLPGALFLSAGGYHHHLGTNTWAPGPSPGPEEAQLTEWELVLPARTDVDAAAHSLRASGYAVEADADGVVVRDPWGTRLRMISVEA